MTEQVKQTVLSEAKRYGKDEYKDFEAEYGWSEWMNEFTEGDESDPISESEAKTISDIQRAIFNEAHFEEMFEEYMEECITQTHMSCDEIKKYIFTINFSRKSRCSYGGLKLWIVW